MSRLIYPLLLSCAITGCAGAQSPGVVSVCGCPREWLPSIEAGAGVWAAAYRAIDRTPPAVEVSCDQPVISCVSWDGPQRQLGYGWAGYHVVIDLDDADAFTANKSLLVFTVAHELGHYHGLAHSTGLMRSSARPSTISVDDCYPDAQQTAEAAHHIAHAE